MNSDSASQYSSEDPTTIEETAAALLPIMDGLITDMKVIGVKVDALEEDLFKRSVRPLPGVMRTIWSSLNLPPAMEFDALLERLFLSSERMDTVTRTIHFTDEYAPIFGKSYMSLYEFVDILIDGLDFGTTLI